MPTPNRYRHPTQSGRRLPGWPELCVYRLAQDVGVTPSHLRAVLTGRREGSWGLLRKISGRLRTDLGVLMDLLKRAAAEDRKRSRVRSGREGKAKK